MSPLLLYSRLFGWSVSFKLIDIVSLISSNLSLTCPVYINVHPLSRNNLERKLQTEYISRSPKQNPFGTDLKREPRPWAELGLGEKVDALYRVCEWQWANPQRFRALLGDDEPTAWVSRVLTMERRGEMERKMLIVFLYASVW